MDIEQITLLFLIAIFALAEIYRARRSVRGVVISLEDSGPLNFLGEVRTVVVRLSSGKNVEAKMTSCTACLGNIELGSEVKIYRSSEGYQVDPIWVRSIKNCVSPDTCGRGS
ncbi:MAG: hypothetical protein V1897_15100 [Pseudomonadota bacterium]